MDVEKLLRDLKSHIPRERRAASYKLGKLKDPATVPALIDSFFDEDFTVYDNVLKALEAIGTPEALDFLKSPNLIAITCPNCSHQTFDLPSVCQSCGIEFDSETIEKLVHLQYLIQWLFDQKKSGLLKYSVFTGLVRKARDDFNQAEQDLCHPEDLQEPEPAPDIPSLPEEELFSSIQLLSAVRNKLPDWMDQGLIDRQSGTSLSHYLDSQLDNFKNQRAAVPSKFDIFADKLKFIDFVLESLPRWTAEIGIGSLDDLRKQLLEEKLEWLEIPSAESVSGKTEPDAEPILAIKAAKREKPPTSIKPEPRPRRKPLDWSKLWSKIVDAFVSGAVLRGILFLGAFMIVVSITVLTITFFGDFPDWLQLLVLFFIPTVFYILGWLVRSRLKLPQAGSVLTGIGAVLLGLVFFAIYRFGEVPVSGRVYWLISSVISTAVYVLTARVIKAEFFGYVTSLGAISISLSVAAVLYAPYVWWVFSVTLASVGMIWGSSRLFGADKSWHELGKSLKRLPQILIPCSLLTALILTDDPAFGKFFTFALACLGYGLLSAKFTMPRYAHACTWISVLAVFFLLDGLGLPMEWFPSAYALLAFGFMMISRMLISKIQLKSNEQGFISASKITAIGLLIGSAVSGIMVSLFSTWACVLATSIVTASLATWSYWFKKPNLAFLAAALFVLPYSLAVNSWMDSAGYHQIGILLMSAWNILAGVYVGLAMLLSRTKSYAARLQVVALVISSIAVFISMFIHFLVEPLLSVTPLLFVQGETLLILLWFAYLLDSGNHPGLNLFLDWLPKTLRPGIFLWPISILLPIMLASSWPQTDLNPVWLGSSLCFLALGFIGLGQLLVKRNMAYRLPFHFMAYLLPVIGVIISGGSDWALLSALVASNIILVTTGVIYQRAIETTLAAVLFIWPFQLALLISPLPSSSFSLAYELLSFGVYLPIGLRLIKTGRKFSSPVLILTYLLSVYSLITSVARVFGTDQEILWIGVVVPLLITGQMIFSRYRFNHWAWSWAAALMFPIAFGKALAWLAVPANQLANVWVLLGFLYLGINRGVERIKARKRMWLKTFDRPLFATSIAFIVMGLFLTFPQIVEIFQVTSYSSGSQQAEIIRLESGPCVLAQILVVLYFSITAFTHKTSIMSHAASWLSFIPITVAGKLYGDLVLSTDLEAVQYSLLWLGWAGLLFVAGYLTDRSEVRYAHGPYLASTLLGFFSLLWSIPDRITNIYTLGGLILLWSLSQLLIHNRRHQSYDDFLNRLLPNPDTNFHKAARTGFLFLAAYGFPIWLVQVLTYNEVPTPFKGLALALCAPLNIAAGLVLGHLRKEYKWPLYSIGYTLTVIGALVSLNDIKVAIYVLSLNSVVYAVSAYLFKQSFWLYLSTILVPVISQLMVFEHFGDLPPVWVSGIFMGLAYLYLGLGRVFDFKAGTSKGQMSKFALPFYQPGLFLSVISLAVALGWGETILAIVISLSGVLLYSLAAWIFDKPIFIYPAAWLFAVPYYLVMSLTELPAQWYGLGWAPLITTYILLGRYLFHKGPLEITDFSSFINALAKPSMPFYLLAYAFSLVMVIVSRADLSILNTALITAAAVYFGSAWIFQGPVWIYPGLLFSNIAVWATYVLFVPETFPSRYIVFPFVLFTWLAALIGLFVSRRSPGSLKEVAQKRSLSIFGDNINLGRWPSIRYVTELSWAQPFLVIAVLNFILWQMVAFSGLDTVIITATLFSLLAGIIAVAWQDSLVIYVTFSLFLIGFFGSLAREGIIYPHTFSWFSGLGLGFYITARIIDEAGKGFASFKDKFMIWINPLTYLSLPITGIATLGILPEITNESTAAAEVFGFTGSLYLTIAYRGRHQRLGYLGLGMLQTAWILMLTRFDVTEPQFYAIPAGIYFGAIGYLERIRGNQVFGMVIEGFGLSVLLVTSFIQSIISDHGFIYFVLLMAEGLVVAWWGIFRQLRNPVFIGIGAVVLNVITQVILLINIYEVERWIIILGVGIVLVTGAIFIERKREMIIAQTKEWRDMLEEWN
jgi:hypothetical protein